jgi:hypothetical protein
MKSKLKKRFEAITPYASALMVLLFTILCMRSANALTLKTNFDHAANAYCETARDFNYYHCLNQVRGCIVQMNSIKSNKQYMTETERSHLILNNCIINNNYRYVEPYTNKQ